MRRILNLGAKAGSLFSIETGTDEEDKGGNYLIISINGEEYAFGVDPDTLHNFALGLLDDAYRAKITL